jgi:hypothetical protein
MLSTQEAGAVEVATIECTFPRQATLTERLLFFTIDAAKGWNVTDDEFSLQQQSAIVTIFPPQPRCQRFSWR